MTNESKVVNKDIRSAIQRARKKGAMSRTEIGKSARKAKTNMNSMENSRDKIANKLAAKVKAKEPRTDEIFKLSLKFKKLARDKAASQKASGNPKGVRDGNKPKPTSPEVKKNAKGARNVAKAVGKVWNKQRTSVKESLDKKIGRDGEYGTHHVGRGKAHKNKLEPDQRKRANRLLRRKAKEYLKKTDEGRIFCEKLLFSAKAKKLDKEKKASQKVKDAKSRADRIAKAKAGASKIAQAYGDYKAKKDD